MNMEKGYHIFPKLKRGIVENGVQICWLTAASSYRGANKSLARPGRKRLTGHLQPRRNWPTWVSNVLITHPLLQIWPRHTTTCSLD
jgi:hypothetical protein